MSSERLQKILAQAGIASRRAAEKYITEGRVRVNGEVVSELGAKADPNEDTIEIDGLGVIEPEPVVYIAMHKPIHVVTTVSDPEKRQTVIDVLNMSRAEGRKTGEGNMPRIFPVGRLDFDAEGLLVLTNDGALANDLLHPRYHVPKTYVVKIRGRPDERQVERLRRGVRLREEDGSMSRSTAPADVNVVRESPSNTWLEMIIVEGRHHQVKRMCEAVGHQVIRLIRTEFGGIELGELEPGQWRFLSEGEVELLRSWRAGNAKDLLSTRRGPSMTERLFGEKPRRAAAKRSGAPRERSTSRPERSGEGEGRARGPRDGAPRAASRGPRADAPRAAGRPMRSDSPRGDRSASAQRGERGAVAARGPRGGVAARGPGSAASRGSAPRKDFAPRTGGGGGRGDFAPRADRGATRSGPPRGDSRGAPRGRPSRDEGRSDQPYGAPRPARAMSPRGVSADRRPRRESGEGRGMSPRVDSRSGNRSAGAPRGPAREGRPGRGDVAPRGDRPARGPRRDSAPRGDFKSRPRRDGDAPHAGRPPARGPRSEGRSSGGGPRGDASREGGKRQFSPRSEGHGARGPKSSPRGPSAGHRRGGPGRHH